MKRDKYYGAEARDYELRKANPKWHAEHKAVAKLLKHGPVLDAPCGTGRFFELYRSRGLDFVGADISQDMLDQARKVDRNADLRKLDILAAPVEGFQTAVCIRLFQWLYPDELEVCMRNLAAPEIIFSVRLGPEGHEHHYTSYTHDEAKLMRRLAGYMVTSRIKVSERKNCTYWVYHCRRPTYSDVTAAFMDRPKGTIEKLVGEFAPRVGLEPFGPSQNIRCEYWDADQHRELIDAQATFDPRARTTNPPRRYTGPIVVVEKDGHRAMIDGRHRAHYRQSQKGLFPVLIMSC